MKSVRVTGKRLAEIHEVPDPKAVADLALVKIVAAPMCTEYKGYRDGMKSDSLGHEAAGVVVDVAQPGKVKVGDRVVVMPQYPCGICALCLAGDYIHCEHVVNMTALTGSEFGRATYAQYLLKQDWLLLPIPDGVPIDHGAMACCGLGPTFGAMEAMHVDRFDTVLITGMGPVGLGGVVNAKYRGARVIAVEGQPYRAELARKLGADVLLDPGAGELRKLIAELTGGVGVDKCIDCTGVPEAQRLLIDSVRRRGEVSFVGEGGDLPVAVSKDMIRKGAVLRGVWHYPLYGYPKLSRIIADSREKLSMLITHTFPLERVADAWELQLTGNCGKVILRPWPESE